MSSDPRRREPALADMLRDPIVTALMARDGVTRDALLRLVAETRERLRRSGALARGDARHGPAASPGRSRRGNVRDIARA